MTDQFADKHVLEAEAVNVWYGNFHALRDVSMKIKENRLLPSLDHPDVARAHSCDVLTE